MQRYINIGDKVILYDYTDIRIVKDIYCAIEEQSGSLVFFVDFQYDSGKIETVPLYMMEHLVKEGLLYPERLKEQYYQYNKVKER